MGKPLMLQEADDARIESLRKRLRARTKIEVVRESRNALKDFPLHSRLHRVD